MKGYDTCGPHTEEWTQERTERHYRRNGWVRRRPTPDLPMEWYQPHPGWPPTPKSITLSKAELAQRAKVEDEQRRLAATRL